MLNKFHLLWVTLRLAKQPFSFASESPAFESRKLFRTLRATSSSAGKVWKSKLGMWCPSLRKQNPLPWPRKCDTKFWVWENGLMPYVGVPKGSIIATSHLILPSSSSRCRFSHCLCEHIVNNWELDSMLAASFMTTELHQLSPAIIQFIYYTSMNAAEWSEWWCVKNLNMWKGGSDVTIFLANSS